MLAMDFCIVFTSSFVWKISEICFNFCDFGVTYLDTLILNLSPQGTSGYLFFKFFFVLDHDHSSVFTSKTMEEKIKQI
jgi:hypothetical protein